MPKSISVSDYWNTFLEKVVQSGIRHSKAQVVAEALAKAHNGAAYSVTLMQSAARPQFSWLHKIYSENALLVRHRRLIENEIQEYQEVRAEIKERKEAMR